jgi:hypothetical protein
MRGAIPPLPNTPSWRVAQKKAQGQLYVDYLRLTPWSRILLEKLLVGQLVKKFPSFYATRCPITVFKRARH